MIFSTGSVWHLWLLVLSLVPLWLARQHSRRPAPPKARVRPRTVRLHGRELTDNYHWLRRGDDPEVRQYLELENEYTRTLMHPTRRLRKTLYDEMLGRIRQTDTSVPYRQGEFFYYHRTEEGKPYPIYCRKKGSLEAAEEVLLDCNHRAAGHDHYQLGELEVSPDHRLLAFSEDTVGDERFLLHIKDLGSGRLLPEQVPNTYYSLEWANDNLTLFYVVVDSACRPHKVFRHRLGTPVSDDVLVHHEPDDAFFASVEKTRSKRFLLICLNSNTTSEVHFLEADRPRQKPRLLSGRRPGIEYSVDHHGDWFYLTTNDDAVNFRLMKAPLAGPARRHWEEVLAHRPDVKLEEVQLFETHMAIFERRNGICQLRVQHLKTGEVRPVEFREPLHTIWADYNPEFSSPELRFRYTSLVTPETVYDHNLADGTRRLKKRQEVLGGFAAQDYGSERVFAKAEDGTRVPISLLYRRRAARPGPLLLYAYGSYGYSLDPSFSSNRLSLVDRGVIFAMAHVRGGGELGRPWYDGGKLFKKRNSFTDFISCAQCLIEEGWTRSDQLVACGGSAGGLLMGAVANLRPDLFQAMVAQVPFVDVVNTMLDAALPLTVTEYEEWGNPQRKQDFDYLLSYSPYENTGARKYPHLLVTAGLNDPRVHYWEPAKWVAKLRSLKTDHNWLLLKTNLSAGHSGASGRYDRLREIAFEYAFILDRLGCSDLISTGAPVVKESP